MSEENKVSVNKSILSLLNIQIENMKDEKESDKILIVSNTF